MAWRRTRPEASDQAIRLLSFLERARNLRAAALPGVAAVLDSGLSRRSLLVVQRWVEGITLSEWLKMPQEREAAYRRTGADPHARPDARLRMATRRH